MDFLLMLVVIPAVIGIGVEYAVCRTSQNSKQRSLWRLVLPGLTVLGALLSPRLLLKQPAEPIGCGMPYLVFFVMVGSCTAGLLIGMLLGWLLYRAGHRDEKVN